MATIQVSEAEFKRLEALKAMEETGQRTKTSADVANDALQFGKKALIAYYVVGLIAFLAFGIWALFMVNSVPQNAVRQMQAWDGGASMSTKSPAPPAGTLPR